MERNQVFHAVVAALLTTFASGGLEFAMTGEWTPLITGLPGVLVGGAYLAGVHLLPKWRNRRGVAHSVDAEPDRAPLACFTTQRDLDPAAMDQAYSPASLHLVITPAENAHVSVRLGRDGARVSTESESCPKLVDLCQCFAILDDSGRMFRQFQCMTTILTLAITSLHPTSQLCPAGIAVLPSRLG